MLQPTPFKFSLNERNRRWQLIRERMVSEGIFALVTPPNTGMGGQLQANARYLTSIGGNCVAVATVFPQKGEVTVIVTPEPGAEFWRLSQDWVSDIRDTQYQFAFAVAKRLREIGASRERIGVVGLSGTPSNPEGLATTGFIEKLAWTLPESKIVDATTWMDEIRDYKSDEEVAALRRTEAIAKVGMDILQCSAKPGVPENVVYARVVGGLLELGSEPPVLLIWAIDHSLVHGNFTTFATKRLLQKGDIIHATIEARFAGYHGYITRTIVVGDAPAQINEMSQLASKIFQNCSCLLRPGIKLSQVILVSQEIAKNTPYNCTVSISACGLGDDAPALNSETCCGRMWDWKIKENTVFAIKIQIRAFQDDKVFYWGGTAYISQHQS